MPAVRLATRAVGAKRHVSAGRGVARGPRVIRADLGTLLTTTI